jgi:hypothetical protein
MRRRLTIAFVALLIFGAVRWPLESKLAQKASEANFHGAKLDISLFEKIGQMGFVAALSGFRTVIADGIWIHANTVWQDRLDWGQMKVDFDAVTTLQPHWPPFWDGAAWHMSHNAAIAALENRKQPRLALRLKAQREYWQLGEDYLLRGIANNPESALLWTALGNLYRDRLVDHCKASEAYGKGAAVPNAPVYLHRFAVYELAKCPGHEREAYEKLRDLYKLGPDEHLPTLLKLLGELQEKLNVPAAEKVDIPPPEP